MFNNKPQVPDELVEKVARAWRQCKTTEQIKFMERYQYLFLKRYHLTLPQFNIITKGIDSLLDSLKEEIRKHS